MIRGFASYCLIQHLLGRMVNYLPARDGSVRRGVCVASRPPISLALRPSLGGRLDGYRPNSRSISQPSSPAPDSGRTEVRVGAGLPAALAGEAAFTGALACETACTRFEKKPACKPGKPATGTP